MYLTMLENNIYPIFICPLSSLLYPPLKSGSSMTAAAALLCGPGLSIEEAVPDAGSQAASLHGLTTCQWLWVCSMILKPAGGYAIHDNPVLYTAISPFV